METLQVTGRTHVGPQTFFGGSSLKILDNRVISVDSNTLGLVRDPYLKQSIHFFFFFCGPALDIVLLPLNGVEK